MNNVFEEFITNVFVVCCIVFEQNVNVGSYVLPDWCDSGS